MGGRMGNLGILTGSKIVGDMGRGFSLSFKRGFSTMVESKEENREEDMFRGEMLFAFI